MFHIFHKWSNWTILSDKIMLYTTLLGSGGAVREIVQVRECSICGLKDYKTTDID
jgi:hypothetical protein